MCAYECMIRGFRVDISIIITYTRLEDIGAKYKKMVQDLRREGGR